MAYGFSGLGGTVTPYGGLSWGGSETARYRLSSRVEMGTSLNLTVEGAHTQRDGQAGSNELNARLDWYW